ncbi:hypothetical protein COT30_05185 [Candidatus Micrarchaeota archaeon CG08_land_8_20_14_0_20_49_17]|nr:MAG: hypothetical protein AUJ13_02760 [Candidatus Micrarchaeota archaeon CG1_02_49_24]PIU09290.1 MAG: hypothetical protein COT30_05185 [Candidatus Micrarchaeota archaeon CG08_land_8_20_14_0_20_49_17]PJA00049.1 MAG: hypothetical protein COX84_00195 [Candidatus Micrarchaeota archaeon CG_4_10_14_0_2_um_filter_49_7]HII53560.1 AbrB/MazE/SpoVT family DNA-binding domain-containing protein [Candidatus Micrarchaeota archaeon]
MDIREHLGLKPGTRIVFEVRENEVVIQPPGDPKAIVDEFTDFPRKLKKLDIKTLKGMLDGEYALH